MKEWKGIGLFVILVVVVSVFGFVVIEGIFDDHCREGFVTDKYILPRINGDPVYYLVLDDFDVRTTESFYYEYDVGDYYKPCS